MPTEQMIVIKELIEAVIAHPVFHAAVIIFAAICADKFLNRRILRYVSKKVQNKSEENAGRYRTIFSVISKIITVIIAFLTVVWVLQLLFNISPTSLIAATGIAGAALGLGAQSLVKDSINGFFILMEDQFNVGDYVTIEGFEGKVQAVSLRMTCVESFDGDRMYIPNGTISRVINHSKENRNVVISVPVSYDEDIDHAISEMEEIAAELKNKIDSIIGEPTVLGVDMLDASSVIIKLAVPCMPGMQYSCRREALRLIRGEMENRGMEIPYSHITIIQKQDGTKE